MRVLVTGGAGYIGSHAAKALAASGFEPIVYDDLSMGHKWAVRWGPLCEGDLNDTDRLRSVVREYRPEAVMHFAASAFVGESIIDPHKYFRNNVGSTLSLLKVLCEQGIDTIVVSSTCAIYGTPETVPITEDTEKNPINPYGESKLFVERMLPWYTRAHGLRWAALRYFNAAGADIEGEIGESHNPETHLIPLVIEAALGRRKSITVFGTDYPSPDGTAVRDYIHVQDLADAHVRALRHLVSGRGNIALNLGTGTGHSVNEIIEAVRRASGRRIAVEHAEKRSGDPACLIAGPARAASTLDWRPVNSSLSNIVDTALRWHSNDRRKATRVAVAAGHRSVAPGAFL
jgi:UDP-glucose-4-epimerase GalE